jgi:ornithine cyclodeaminase/alanine dehydrogenase-like protein (mu-crystallin family)
LLDAVEAMFVAKATGTTFLKPKIQLDIVPGLFFQSLVGAAKEPPIAVTKWIGVASDNAKRDLPVINSLIVLNDLETGRPVAILDGNWITAARTAAMTAVAAKYMARADSEVMSFIGCGVQAHSHLAALARVLPRLRRVIAFSRSQASAEGLVKAATTLGLAAEIATDVRAAVEAADVLVTGVSPSSNTPFIDPSWTKPGVFVGAVDLGRPLHRADLRQVFATIATDDHKQSAEIGATGKLAFAGPFDADLGELASGQRPGRQADADKVMFLFPGLGLGDLAVAIAVYQSAERQGLGLRIPR